MQNLSPEPVEPRRATPEELEQHRASLTGHCYRMLGSVVDAEDAVQETMVRAWRALPSFDGRSSLRSWLYRIATNVCLDALGDRKGRVRAFDERPVGSVDDELESKPRTHWLEPVPDACVIPADVDPSERLLLRENVRLAFVAALQRLPPKPRAVLLLADVLDFSSAEIAQILEASVASVNSALQRARATVANRPDGEPPVVDAVEEAVVQRYLGAFERYDMDALAALLHEDAIMSMPPYTLWLRGANAIRAWMTGRGLKCRGSRLVQTRANGAPAFGQYRYAHDRGEYCAWSLNVLELAADKIARTTFFLDVAELFPRFGLSLILPA